MSDHTIALKPFFMHIKNDGTSAHTNTDTIDTEKNDSKWGKQLN